MLERIVDYESVADAGPDGVSVVEVTFKLDFGPWKKGQKVDCLALDGDILTEWSDEGEKLKTCKVKMVPADE